MRVCTVDGCGKRAHARGLCKTHDRRWRTTGTFDPSPNYRRPPVTVAERAWPRRNLERYFLAQFPLIGQVDGPALVTPGCDRDVQPYRMWEHCDVSRHTWWRWEKTGIPESTADRIATRLGVHPCEVWPGWFDPHWPLDLDLQDPGWVALCDGWDRKAENRAAVSWDWGPWLEACARLHDELEAAA